MDTRFTLNTLVIGGNQLSLDGLSPQKLQNFLEANKLATSFTVKTLKTSTHFRSQPLGIQIEFDPDLAAVFLYLIQKGFKRCADQTLPYGLNFGQKSSDILYLLGEPSRKHGGGSQTLTTFCYPRLGFDVVFDSSVWKPDAEVASYCFYVADPKDQTCGSCKAKSTNQITCCNRTILYCGTPCKDKFMAFHTKLCKNTSV